MKLAERGTEELLCIKCDVCRRKKKGNEGEAMTFGVISLYPIPYP